MKKTKLLLLLLLLLPSLANAADFKIFAVVNGESISTSQVRDRVQLIISSSGMENTEANKKAVTQEVAEILINEELQKQDAKEKNITLSEEEVRSILAELETRNKLKPGGIRKFIESKGLSFDTMLVQIKSSILWKKILGTYVRPAITVTPADIKKAEAGKAKPDNKNKVDISEIIIPIEYGSENAAKELADTVVKAANDKTQSFEDLALKYSAGKTGPQKGYIGWVAEDGITGPMAAKVKATAKGKLAGPIKIESLYVIIKVNDRQPITPVDPTPPVELAFMEKMEQGAKKYIKALRDNAYIEKKYTDAGLYDFVWK